MDLYVFKTEQKLFEIFSRKVCFNKVVISFNRRSYVFLKRCFPEKFFRRGSIEALRIFIVGLSLLYNYSIETLVILIPVSKSISDSFRT